MNFCYTLALWGELRILYADGSEEMISTDEGWEAGLGPVVRTDLQKGEVYDARTEPHLTIAVENPGHVQHGVKEIRVDGKRIDRESEPFLTEKVLSGRSKASVQVIMGS